MLLPAHYSIAYFLVYSVWGVCSGRLLSFWGGGGEHVRSPLSPLGRFQVQFGTVLIFEYLRLVAGAGSICLTTRWSTGSTYYN